MTFGLARPFEVTLLDPVRRLASIEPCRVLGFSRHPGHSVTQAFFTDFREPLYGLHGLSVACTPDSGPTNSADGPDD